MRARFVNEHMNFEKKKDPLSSLGVGKIHLIRSWLDEMEVKNYKINDDLTIDVKGDVRLSNRGLTGYPPYIRFNKVDGHFYCRVNQLTSLEGCPSQVGGDFSCYNNQLTSLDGCPSQVGGGFNCSGNRLTNLDGCPSQVSAAFICYNNPGKFTKEDVLKLCEIDKDRIYNES